jgi:hypothetical protein
VLDDASLSPAPPMLSLTASPPLRSTESAHEPPPAETSASSSAPAPAPPRPLSPRDEGVAAGPLSHEAEWAALELEAAAPFQPALRSALRRASTPAAPSAPAAAAAARAKGAKPLECSPAVARARQSPQASTSATLPAQAVTSPLPTTPTTSRAVAFTADDEASFLGWAGRLRDPLRCGGGGAGDDASPAAGRSGDALHWTARVRSATRS